VDGDLQVELALDRMHIVGHDYSEVEIEAELKRGDAAVLDDVREAIESLGEVRESEGSKLSRAMHHLSACRCHPDAERGTRGSVSG
jgi:inorganic triphosphatase YgiF